MTDLHPAEKTATPTEKNCPRCQAIVRCHAAAIEHCACASVGLSDATRAFLAKTYFDCLCTTCLQQLDQLMEQSRELQFPTQREAFVEGLHYYKENGFWVFTELYHLLRGHCCGSGCRHCAYGFKKVAG